MELAPPEQTNRQDSQIHRQTDRQTERQAERRSYNQHAQQNYRMAICLKGY